MDVGWQEMTLINLHVYESKIKPCSIYIFNCTVGPASPSVGGGDMGARVGGQKGKYCSI